VIWRRTRDISASGYEFEEIALHNSTADNNAMNYLHTPENPVPVKRTAQLFMITAFLVAWFDMWRFAGGKADEHWDPATK
jgi:hypothetical protein